MPHRPIAVRLLIRDQCLQVLEAGRVAVRYNVSTSMYGAGEMQDSQKTPRGRHEVAEMIGAGQPAGAVFRHRKATGRIWTDRLVDAESAQDWILTRIIRLRGCEPGHNRGGSVDTYNRFIYIHGTAQEQRIGHPASHGCIRMRNDDVIELFDLLEPGTPVDIVA